MAVVQPFKGKAKIEQFGPETKVIIPCRGKTSRVVYLVIMTAFLIYIVMDMFFSLPPYTWQEASYFFRIIFGLAVVYSVTVVLWNLFGKEILSIATSTLSVKKNLFGLQLGRTYDRSQVSDVRVSPEPAPPFWEKGFRQSGLSGGVIAFDYGAKTIRCGVGIDEAEAKQILEYLRSRNLI